MAILELPHWTWPFDPRDSDFTVGTWWVLLGNTGTTYLFVFLDEMGLVFGENKLKQTQKDRSPLDSWGPKSALGWSFCSAYNSQGTGEVLLKSGMGQFLEKRHGTRYQLGPSRCKFSSAIFLRLFSSIFLRCIQYV